MIKELKKISNILWYVGSACLLSACQQGEEVQEADALFSHFKYVGNDQVYQNYPLLEDHFYSPILQGCYPDPSITRKGSDYYLVNSSFAMFPGVPIFHSTDLVNWTQLGHVLDRESELNIKNAGISEGIYAPDIQYNPHNDTFYMVTTQISGGIGNMVVKTDDPKKGDWTDLNKLNFDGIDPALFFNDDGKAYILHNDAPDEGKELYTGHRVIKIWDYDLKTDQVVDGTDQIIVDGGVDINEKPIWIEGPHLYKKDGKYVLMCAEGGTGSNHSEVVFIGDNPRGPFTPAATNPILSQRHLDKSRPNRVEWAGHADLVEGPDGAWYGVFLAVRPNINNRVNTGRETFILPVDWSGTWPSFIHGMSPLKPYILLPEGVSNQTKTGRYFPNGNFTFQDDFENAELDGRWVALRGPREKFARQQHSDLHLTPFAASMNEKKPISALFYRQQHKDFVSEVILNYLPKSSSDFAGITCLQSESFYYTMGLTKIYTDFYLVLEQMSHGVSKILAKEKIDKPKELSLRVASKNDEYQFSYKQADGSYRILGGVLSGDILSTDVAGGFTGALVGLYSTSANHMQLTGNQN